MPAKFRAFDFDTAFVAQPL